MSLFDDEKFSDNPQIEIITPERESELEPNKLQTETINKIVLNNLATEKYLKDYYAAEIKAKTDYTVVLKPPVLDNNDRSPYLNKRSGNLQEFCQLLLTPTAQLPRGKGPNIGVEYEELRDFFRRFDETDPGYQDSINGLAQQLVRTRKLFGTTKFPDASNLQDIISKLEKHSDLRPQVPESISVYPELYEATEIIVDKIDKPAQHFNCSPKEVMDECKAYAMLYYLLTTPPFLLSKDSAKAQAQAVKILSDTEIPDSTLFAVYNEAQNDRAYIESTKEFARTLDWSEKRLNQEIIDHFGKMIKMTSPNQEIEENKVKEGITATDQYLKNLQAMTKQ